MSPDKEKRSLQILEHLLELPKEQQRAELKKECGDDADLLAAVNKLLKNLATETLAFEKGGVYERLVDLVDLSGQEIGGYKLERLLGRGGMGSVYLAVRERSGVVQKVALKLLSANSEDQARLERFATEQKILASLRHPYIAMFIEMSAPQAPKPYYVMEYAEGEEIHEFCDQQSLTVAKRIVLWMKVCDAVQSSHRQLIIHRDIKPSNIIVNEDGLPKLLDFGAATLLDETLGSSEATATRVPVTVDYASPERLQHNSTSTGEDQYALSVLLYELVAGQRPFKRQRPHLGAAFDQATTETPPPLIDTFSNDETDIKGLARARSTSVGHLRSVLTSDLDAILSKALSTDPDARYLSIEAMVNDVSRYLDRLPVQAKPTSLMYRLRRYVERNALVVLVTLASAIALVAALATTLAQYRESVQSLDRAEAVSEFLGKVLAAPSTRWRSELRTGPDASIQQVLTAASDDLQSDDTLAPDIRIRLHSALSEAFMAWGVTEQALQESRRAVEVAEAELAADDPVRAEAFTQIAIMLDLEETEESLREASVYLDQAVGWLRRYTPDNYQQLVLSLGELGYNRSRSGNHQEAIEHYHEALGYWRELGGTELHPLAALGYGVMGESYLALGRVGDAETVFEKSITAYEHHKGIAISAWPIPYINLLLIHQYRADASQVIDLSDKAMRIADRAVQDEPRTTLVRALVALLLLHNDQTANSQQILENLAQDPNAQTPNAGINAVVSLAQAELWLAQDQPERALPILASLKTLEEWPYPYLAVTYEVALAEAMGSSVSTDTADLLVTMQTRRLSDKSSLARRIDDIQAAASLN